VTAGRTSTRVPGRMSRVCPSGCLRPAQDVVSVAASPELPENADRVASVLRHAGSGSTLPPMRPARRIWPSVPDIARRTVPAARAADTPRPGRCRLADDVKTTRMRLAWVPGLDDGGDRAPSDQAHRGAPAAGVPGRRPSRPDRRPSRPAVSPTYAQGSYYGTNQVVASAPGRLAGPAAPLPSTTRAAQPPGRDPRRSRCSVARTGRVSRKNGTTGRGDARAGVRGRLRESARASRVAISAPTSTSSSSVPIVATTSRPPSGRFLTWARCGSRRPTTRSRGQGHPGDHLHAIREADRQAAAAQQAPSAGPRHPTPGTSPEATGQGHHGEWRGGRASSVLRFAVPARCTPGGRTSSRLGSLAGRRRSGHA
jgi:hypothetical protein